MKFLTSYKIFIVVYIIALLSVYSVFAKVNGSGKLIEETRDIKDFTGIKITGSVDIYLSQSEYYEVRIKGDDNIIPLIITHKDGNGHLVVASKKSFTATKGLKLYVSMPNLDEILISGSGNIISDNKFSGETLEINISGSGDISLPIDYNELNATIAGSGDIFLQGKALTMDLKITGSGDFDCSELETIDSKVKIMGSGNANIKAENSLDANIMGSGDIRYSGNPEKLETSILGSGNVEKVDYK